MNTLKFICAFFVVATVCAGTPRMVIAVEKPNIVLLFIDDWAWNGTPVPMHDGMDNSRMPVLWRERMILSFHWTKKGMTTRSVSMRGRTHLS